MATEVYKGETLSIVFSAYADSDPSTPLDISAYTKKVEVFTPYSLKLHPVTKGINATAFQIELSSEETSKMSAGPFNMVVTLSKKGETKIGKSIPFNMLEPYAGCAERSNVMSVDSGSFHFNMLFGSSNNILLDGQSAADFVKTSDLTKVLGTASDKAPSEAAVSLVVSSLVDNIANATTNDKGIFSTLAELQSSFPQATNKKDWYAFVGTVNPRKKYAVKADAGAWTDTGETHNVAEVDLTEYAKHATIYNVSQDKAKYDYATKADARNAVTTTNRALGQLITYKMADGKWVFERFVGANVSEWGDVTKWEDGSMGGSDPKKDEIIPYSNKGTISGIGYSLYYLTPSAIRGKEIDRIKVNIAAIGILTIRVAKDIPTKESVVSSQTINITKLGEQIIELTNPITLGDDEFIGFGSTTDTATYKVDTTKVNPIGGGYAYFGKITGTYARDICIGVYQPPSDDNVVTIGTMKGYLNKKTDKQSFTNVSQDTGNYSFVSSVEARNNIPFIKDGITISYRLLTGQWMLETWLNKPNVDFNVDENWEQIKDRINLDELIPYSNVFSGESKDYAFYYLNQMPLHNVAIDRIRLNAVTTGSLTISVATGIPNIRTIVDSFKIDINVLGEQLVKLPKVITLTSGQFIGFGDVRDTAIFRLNTNAPNPVGGGYAFYGNTTGNYERNICIGVVAENATLGKPTSTNQSIINLNKDKELDIRGLSTTITSHLTTKKIRVLSFMHFSDTHGDKEQIDRAIEALNGLGGIDFALNSGDTLFDNSSHSFEEYKKAVLISQKLVYHCIGNHDMYGSTVSAMYPVLIQPLESKLEIATQGNMFYYKDIKGVRFIFLNEYESGVGNTHNSYISDTQLNWLIETLKGADYAIIVTHQPPLVIKGENVVNQFGYPINGYNDFYDFNTNLYRYTYYKDIENPVVDIVEAWINGTSLTKEYIPSGGLAKNTVNATFTKKGNFICYVTGHLHYDKFGYVGNTKQLSVTVSCTIFQNIYSDFVRTKGSKSQDVINLMSVSLDDKTLTILRLGADVVYQGRDRKKIIVTWDRNKINI